MEPRPYTERPSTYTVDEVATLMRMSPGLVRKAVRRYVAGDRGPGTIPGRITGTCYRIKGAYVDEWLRAEAPAPAEKPRSIWA